MTVLLGEDLLGNNTHPTDVHFEDETCVGYKYDSSNIALYTTYDMCLTTRKVMAEYFAPNVSKMS